MKWKPIACLLACASISSINPTVTFGGSLSDPLVTVIEEPEVERNNNGLPLLFIIGLGLLVASQAGSESSGGNDGGGDPPPDDPDPGLDLG